MTTRSCNQETLLGSARFEVGRSQAIGHLRGVGPEEAPHDCRQKVSGVLQRKEEDAFAASSTGSGAVLSRTSAPNVAESCRNITS